MHLRTLSLLFIFLGGVNSYAGHKLAMDVFIERELKTANQAMKDIEAPVMAGAENEDWYFRRTLLRVRPQIGFDVVFGKLQVIPEVEIIWQKSLPEGWEVYVPK